VLCDFVTSDSRDVSFGLEAGSLAKTVRDDVRVRFPRDPAAVLFLPLRLSSRSRLGDDLFWPALRNRLGCISPLLEGPSLSLLLYSELLNGGASSEMSFMLSLGAGLPTLDKRRGTDCLWLRPTKRLVDMWTTQVGLCS
jgi:hypothetical protein